MVALDTIRSSNASISKTVRPGLVAVFAGATAGIGESSLQHFAKNTVRPKIYFIGRSKESGSRVSEELKKLNPDGEYIFMSVDVSLLASVDEACRKIKERESTINVLFLSTGTMLPGKGKLQKGQPRRGRKSSHPSAGRYRRGSQLPRRRLILCPSSLPRQSFASSAECGWLAPRGISLRRH